MLVIFNIPLCDYRNEMLTDVTDMKHGRSRNEDVVRARVRGKK